MVKIKAAMSADSSDGEGEATALTAVRDKLKIQQRLIDISARSLLNSRASTVDLSQSFESQSALEVQRENNSIQEVSCCCLLDTTVRYCHSLVASYVSSALVGRGLDALVCWL